MGLNVNIDTTNEELLKKPNFEPIPEGTYEFEIANNLKTEKAKSSDNMVVKVELRCVDDDEKVKGKKIFDTLVLTEEAMWKIAQLCKSCGLESENGKIDLEELTGSTCTASVKIEEYTNKNNEKRLTNRITEYHFDGEEDYK